ncbi:MAG TPA: type I pullulanase [Ktedonobacter sp.]|nr:type I pullulanase [Ktedonobacter sp.]
MTTSTESDTQEMQRLTLVNAYLEDVCEIVVTLASPATLPLDTSTALVTDETIGEKLAIVSVDMRTGYHAVVVGDLQPLLGAKSAWNPGDTSTQMQMVNPNLYQFSGKLPTGTYNYKIAFDGVFDNALPRENVVLTVPEGGADVTFSFVPYEPMTHHRQCYDSINNPTVELPTSSAGVETNVIAVTLAQEPDITHILHVSLNESNISNVMPRNVLGLPKYTYNGDDLGARCSQEGTAFRVWTPTASDVQLLLYDTEFGPLTKQVAMQRSEAGTWYALVQQDVRNWYYLYLVTVQEDTQVAVDPYARAIGVNATRGMIVDLPATNPDGWSADTYKPLAHSMDAILYELHVRDFSIDPNSGMEHKGQYLAFTERGTKGPDDVSTGVDSLVQLGITHVQLQPIQEFASVDELDTHGYNWGYDPRNYDVPEGAYASTPHGIARINECKRMIQSLHSAGIGVIMDVVYNHTFTVRSSDFDKLVPQYYYRTDESGGYTNGSGVGNELATERPMVQKFVIDSVKYWVREYHVDGYRFDLMALIGVETMQKLIQELQAINPDVLVYGEPWTGNGSGLPGSQLLTKGRQKGTGIGVFNDDLRNGLYGSVFDAGTQGFATGAQGLTGVIQAAVKGSIDTFTAQPGEVINYVTSHDNYTLWDKITKSNGGDPEYDRILMDELAQAIVMTSQGIPFMQGGEEFLRTKGGSDNSYNAGDSVNEFDWSRKAHYIDVFNYYASLIHLRKAHPAFRMTSAEDIQQHLTFLNSPANTVAFQISGHANGDSWGNIIVIYNPNKLTEVITLPAGSWTIFATQGHVGGNAPGQASGTVIVPGISCVILYQNS